MFEKEAEEYANGKGHERYNYLFEESAGSPADFARMCFKDGAEFGYEQGIGRLRYCCTCKKWKECGVESMYGICADWEIKGE